MNKKRFVIEILDNENWLIEDTETGLDYNPIDGTSNVLKGLVDLVNNLYEENKKLKEENKELRQYLSWQDMELEEIEDAKRCC